MIKAKRLEIMRWSVMVKGENSTETGEQVRLPRIRKHEKERVIETNRRNLLLS